MAEKTAQTIYIEAKPSTVMDVIADIGSYPDWVSEYTEAEVLEADSAGNPKVARLVLDTSSTRSPARASATAVAAANVDLPTPPLPTKRLIRARAGAADSLSPRLVS